MAGISEFTLDGPRKTETFCQKQDSLHIQAEFDGTATLSGRKAQQSAV